MQAIIDNTAGEPLRRPLMISAVGHVLLASFALLFALQRNAANIWGEGGGGGAATVQLVSSASIPLPSPTVETDNKVATQNPGLNYPEPPKPSEVQPIKKAVPETIPEPENAIELPGRKSKVIAKTTAQPVTGKKIEKAQDEPPPIRPEARPRKAPDPETRASNEVPYGQGGPVQGPYGMFHAEGGTGGLEFQGGAADFASRYNWYVSAIRNRISSNWLKSSVDPSVRVAPRVFITFQILRDGTVANAQVTTASGISALDNSALRAVLDSNPMPQLPSDYPGSSVTVQFWFDLQR